MLFAFALIMLIIPMTQSQKFYSEPRNKVQTSFKDKRAGFFIGQRRPPNLCSGPTCIRYNKGAKVLTDPVKLYYIYYGSFTPAQKAILENFGNNVGKSPWYNINRRM
jgi:hypothetical protein